MRNKRFIVLIFALGASFFLAGCTQGTPENDAAADAVFQQWLTNAKQMASAQVYAEGYIETLQQGKAVKTDLNGTLYYRGNDFRQDFDVKQDSTGIATHVDAYSINGKVTACQNIANKFTCMQLEDRSVPTTQQEYAFYDSIYQKKAFSFSTGTPRTVAGKTCTPIGLTVDILKLSAEEKDFVALMGNLQKGSGGLLKSFSLKMCVVPEEGINYESEVNTELIDGTKLHSDVVQTNTIKNGNIPDSVFEVPNTAP